VPWYLVFFLLSPFYTVDFVSNLSGFVSSSAFYPLLLYFSLRYVTSKNKLSLDFLCFTVISIFFSFGNSLGAPPVIWWELVIGIVFPIGLHALKLYKIYLTNLRIALLILVISFVPFLPSYLVVINSLGYETTHSTFLGKSLLEYNLVASFSIMSLHNFGYLYYVLDYSFSVYKGSEIYLLIKLSIIILSSLLLIKDKKLLKFSSS